MCVCEGKERERGAGPRGPDGKAKLPMKRQAGEASNRLLHVIWMRPELPAEQTLGLGPLWF